eukprot:1148766-Pelagomonas_calceolata.AAC.10
MKARSVGTMQTSQETALACTQTCSIVALSILGCKRKRIVPSKLVYCACHTFNTEPYPRLLPVITTRHALQTSSTLNRSSCSEFLIYLPSGSWRPPHPRAAARRSAGCTGGQSPRWSCRSAGHGHLHAGPACVCQIQPFIQNQSQETRPFSQQSPPSAHAASAGYRKMHFTASVR